MKHKRLLKMVLSSCFLFALLNTLLLSCISITGAESLTENFAFIELRHFYQHTTENDQILDVPQAFNSWSGIYFLNWPDETHEPIINPNATLITESPLSGVWAGLPWGYYGPLDPNVTNPPNYMWFWETNLLEGMEPADAIDIHAFHADSSVFTPEVSLKRNVCPSIIRGPHVVQLTVACLTIKKPLPEDVNSINVAIATWGGSQHVTTKFLTASPRPSVVYRTQDIQWHIPASQLEVGKTYKFRALFQVFKRVDQDVLFKPHVGVGVSYRLQQPIVQGNSITIQHPDGISAIVSGENLISWSVVITGGYGLGLSKVSEALLGSRHKLLLVQDK